MRLSKLMGVCKDLAAANRWCVGEATLRAFAPEDLNTFRVAMSRHVRGGAIARAAPGLYLNPFIPPPAWALERLASRLRPDDFFYVSLESALHEHGWLSQVPTVLTLMTSGRSHIYSTPLGGVEFAHTDEPPEVWRSGTTYLPERKIHFASPELAYRDLQRIGRNLDLVEQPEE